MERKCLWVFIAAITLLQACGKDHDQPRNPDGNNPPGNTHPKITAITPARGTPGTIVTIQGKNFGEGILKNRVLFEGAAIDAEVTAASTTELKARVPIDAVTGKIIVKVGNQADTSATAFIVDPEATAITDFTPKQGPLGTTVTITGTKFGNNITVKINGVEAKVSQRSATQIVITIPVNTSLTAHKIVVHTDADVLETAEPFTVVPSGPYARWEPKNVVLFGNGGNAFPFGTSFVYKNKIYWGFNNIVSGESESRYAIYDPAQPAEGWQVQNPVPQEMAPAKVIRMAAIVHNDRVFMGTGFANVGRNHWYEFHPETNTATRLTDYPHEVAGALTFTLNNKIFVGFGSDNKNLYQFNPAANNNLGSWTLAAGNAPFSELNTGSAVVLGNEVFMGRALPAMQQLRSAMYKYTEAGGITRVTDIPEDVQSLTNPSFPIGNKIYFVTDKNVWEYTPGGDGGSWRAVIRQADSPSIQYVAELTVNGARVVYGWTSSGRLFEFTL